MTHPRISSIYSRAHGPAPTGTEAADRNHAAFTEAWQHRGLLVIYPDTLGEWEAKLLEAIAVRVYGVRGGI